MYADAYTLCWTCKTKHHLSISGPSCHPPQDPASSSAASSSAAPPIVTLDAPPIVALDAPPIVDLEAGEVGLKTSLRLARSWRRPGTAPALVF